MATSVSTRSLVFSKTNASGERQSKNHTLSISEFTPDKNNGVTGSIKSIVYAFRFNYSGTSNPSWTGNVSIVAKDGTVYKGDNSTYTVNKNTGANVMLTIPEEKCPPPSVINSGDFSIKLTTTSCSKDPYVPQNSTLRLTVNYAGAVVYAYGATNRNACTYPVNAMTENNSQDCVASASSESSQAYLAFDKSANTGVWTSASDEGSAWIQLQMPKALCNINVKLTNANIDNSVNGPVAGVIYGMNSNEDEPVQIGVFSNRDGLTQGAETTIVCNSTDAAYSIVRVSISDWANKDSSGVSVGEIEITGDEVLEWGWLTGTPYIRDNDTWKEATAYVHASDSWR